MTAEELYKHITSHMTAEEALMKLLTGHLREYDKLKFSQEGEEIHPIILISMATLDMGWNFAVPNHNDNPDAEVEGMIVGTQEYVDSVLSKKENNDKFERLEKWLKSDEGKKAIIEAQVKGDDIIDKMNDIDPNKLREPFNI